MLRAYQSDAIVGQVADKTAKNPLDVTGEQLKANIRRIREARNFTFQKLSDELARIGRPIPTLGLSRIEKGERRVDADDLVALALVLGVNVSALLLPPTARGVGEVTGVGRPVSSFRLWTWASGEQPLPPEDDPSVDKEKLAQAKADDFGMWSDYWDERGRRWDTESRPHHRIDRSRDWAKHHEALSRAASAAQAAVDAGMSLPAVLDFLMESVTQHAMFERVDGSERELVTVGDQLYNLRSASDNWRQLPDEEVRAFLAASKRPAADTET
ncbi:hypothetical protein GCM10022419_008000 [Nonomuraea rosea]|uniref:HTH cro/C1-type domain-containing protein n=1 Tax=Nonomuraea rosea TaxID=638574 RepID=A0ABP6VA02_9ACTN